MSDQVISLWDCQTFCVRAGDVKIVEPESIVTGAQGSWKSTVNTKFAAVVTPRGVTALIVIVNNYSEAGSIDSNETCRLGESRVIAAGSDAGKAGLIAIAYVIGQ